MLAYDAISINAFFQDNCIPSIQLNRCFVHGTEKKRLMVCEVHSQTAFGIEAACYPPVYPLPG